VQDGIRAALAWALGGQEPEAGRELAARLARWWLATGRYSEADRFLASALEVPAAADPPIQARVLLGAAWSAYNLGDNPAAARLGDQGLACARQAGEPQLELWGRNLLASLAWLAGNPGRVRALLEDGGNLLDHADPALASWAHVMLANAALLTGDLTEQQRHGQRAAELARAAPGQERLALALNVSAVAAITGTGISPATQAALDEALAVANTQEDRFTETIIRHWRARLFATTGQLDAAETEAGLCWAAGRDGAVRLVEAFGPLADARVAAATGDSAAALEALDRAAAGGRQARATQYLPLALAARACLADTRAALGERRESITQAMLTHAEAITAWHRGELADA
jgi:hypothetical protein